MSEKSVAALFPRLFPLLRPTRYHAGLALPLVRVRFAPLIWAHVAIESEQDFRLLVPEDAAVFQRTFAELLAMAWSNLAELEHPFERHPDAPIAYRCATHDGFAAARLSLPGFLGSLAERFGPVVATIPNSASLWIAPRDQAGAVERLLELTEAAWADHEEPISPVPYVADARGAVTPLSLEASDPLHDRLRRAHVAFLTRTYAEQRAALLEGASAAGVELEVAICGATTHPELGAVTTTRLTRGLMPVTDFVFVVWHEGDAEQALLVEREDLMRIARGRLVPAGDHEPALDVVVSAPSDAEIEQLKLVARWTSR